MASVWATGLINFSVNSYISFFCKMRMVLINRDITWHNYEVSNISFMNFTVLPNSQVEISLAKTQGPELIDVTLAERMSSIPKGSWELEKFKNDLSSLPHILLIG